MAVRSSMAALITRERMLIYDLAGPNPLFTDQDIQDVLDESRIDVTNGELITEPTFSGTTPQWLQYWDVANRGDWEDDLVLKQYLTTVVTPSTSENIVGKWTFAASTLPPVFITGKTYDVYRSAADLLERMAARWVLLFDATTDGITARRSQASAMLEKRIMSLRLKQRASSIQAGRSDLGGGPDAELSLKAKAIDYMASG